MPAFSVDISVASDSLETEVLTREGDSQPYGMGTWYWKVLAYRQVTPDLGVCSFSGNEPICQQT